MTDRINQEDIFQAIEEMRKEEYPTYDAIIDDEGLENFVGKDQDNSKVRY